MSTGNGLGRDCGLNRRRMKTFVAIRFLCIKALSDGYKVLWLAHTHHLLEQAFREFETHANKISETQSQFNIRVVSGTKGHFRVHAIESTDNVVIATLQTITKAYNERHPQLEKFLESTDGKLFVVFDEAHHAPAPSYRKLIKDLRERYPKMYLLGLTATPFYSDEKMQGWLSELFPQGFPNVITPRELMAQNILAEPITEQFDTGIKPDFDEREYQKWIGTFKDIPEGIITKLALNRDRNLKIAKHYSDHIKKYGKTIIFADRWFQCEAISEFLTLGGVRTGTIYNHIDADPGSADARNKRKADENNEVLEKFRKNELDVVLNVRMLTEGTDVPDVQSIFITRQTTSKILLTQMVGRGLRGPAFGGTEKAYLVFFTDNWEKLINWAEYEPLKGAIGIDPEPPGRRPPLHYISIELVRKLAVQMHKGINANLTEFKKLLPLGWYRVEYAAKQADNEEIELVQRLILVFDNEEENYKRLIEYLLNPRPIQFENESIQFEDFKDAIIPWQETFFPHIEEHFGSNLSQDIFSIVRHIAQRDEPPMFFKFVERENHDLDKHAKDIIDRDLGPKDVNEEVRKEYLRCDRYWKVFYPTFDDFKHQYNGCVERILNPPSNTDTGGIISKDPGPEEPTEEIKNLIRTRDGKCVCCGRKNSLQVDHINPKHFKGTHETENLQALCSECNNIKGQLLINFLKSQTKLETPLESLPKCQMPNIELASDVIAWKEFIRRTINFFYQCGAVHDVTIGVRGKAFYNWMIILENGNNPKWLDKHFGDLLAQIRNVKEEAGKGFPNSITISAPKFPAVTVKLSGGQRIITSSKSFRISRPFFRP
jgi:superfamily II DNA or RNA helicase/5-methylcytosine-specific restriction endonuclease McrA